MIGDVIQFNNSIMQPFKKHGTIEMMNKVIENFATETYSNEEVHELTQSIQTLMTMFSIRIQNASLRFPSYPCAVSNVEPSYLKINRALQFLKENGIPMIGYFQMDDALIVHNNTSFTGQLVFNTEAALYELKLPALLPLVSVSNGLETKENGSSQESTVPLATQQPYSTPSTVAAESSPSLNNNEWITASTWTPPQSPRGDDTFALMTTPERPASHSELCFTTPEKTPKPFLASMSPSSFFNSPIQTCPTLQPRVRSDTSLNNDTCSAVSSCNDVARNLLEIDSVINSTNGVNHEDMNAFVRGVYKGYIRSRQNKRTISESNQSRESSPLTVNDSGKEAPTLMASIDNESVSSPVASTDNDSVPLASSLPLASLGNDSVPPPTSSRSATNQDPLVMRWLQM